MKELYYSTKDVCFSKEQKEGFFKLPDLGSYINERFFYYCESLIYNETIESEEHLKEIIIDFLENALSENERYDFIRYRLDKDNLGRFDMAWSESPCRNINIINAFADLGIYDYTSFLYLDFYKGSGFLYYKYFREERVNLFDSFGGWKTVEIIDYIFSITIFSNKKKR